MALFAGHHTSRGDSSTVSRLPSGESVVAGPLSRGIHAATHRFWTLRRREEPRRASAPKKFRRLISRAFVALPRLYSGCAPGRRGLFLHRGRLPGRRGLFLHRGRLPGRRGLFLHRGRLPGRRGLFLHRGRLPGRRGLFLHRGRLPGRRSLFLQYLAFLCHVSFLPRDNKEGVRVSLVSEYTQRARMVPPERVPSRQESWSEGLPRGASRRGGSGRPTAMTCLRDTRSPFPETVLPSRARRPRQRASGPPWAELHEVRQSYASSGRESPSRIALGVQRANSGGQSARRGPT